MAKVCTGISPALHPDNVKSIDGYNERTAQVLGPTETAFSEAYEGIQMVREARAKAATNPTWNEAQQLIHTQVLADKVVNKITRSFDSVRINLVKGIEHLENELSQPVESRAAHSVASEIRAHSKSLETGPRLSLIRQAIAEGDHTTATAILGAPPYLSGHDAKLQATLLREYHSTYNPEAAERLQAMRGAREMIENRGGLVFPEMEKAVGMRSEKVRALGKAQNAAEQAFILSDAA